MEREKFREPLITIEEPTITFHKGEVVEVTNKKGKAKVLRAIGEFADVDVNGKTYLIGKDFKLKR